MDCGKSASSEVRHILGKGSFAHGMRNLAATGVFLAAGLVTDDRV
jgi:hypothetical protein